CVIVKHANPCGAAVADTAEAAYERGLSGDPLSAYGGIVALDHPVDAALGARLAQQFVEILIAPCYDDAALEALRAKPSTRVLRGRDVMAGGVAYRSVPGGMLVQERDTAREGREDMEVVCGSPTDGQWSDLVFAWIVCKHASSNAIVLAKDGMVIGVGAGQQGGVDAVRLALEKARDRGHDLRGAALASDAFFPFADGPGLALEAGVAAIVQPGGSKRDREVIAEVEAAGAAMVFTGVRHFRH